MCHFVQIRGVETLLTQMKLLHEGKAKQVYETGDPDTLRIFFKDAATAGDGAKKGTIKGKGSINNEMSCFLFSVLAEKDIPTHFIKKLSENEMLVKRLDIVPIEVVVRNIVAGSLSKRMGKPEGAELSRPVLEFYYKDDSLHDPLINRYHALSFGLASSEQLDEMSSISFRVNDVLRPFLAERGIDLVDFKLEFGVHKSKILLGDEISPDTCRFWDSKTKKKLDKDRFRRGLGDIESSYKEALERITK